MARPTDSRSTRTALVARIPSLWNQSPRPMSTPSRLAQEKSPRRSAATRALGEEEPDNPNEPLLLGAPWRLCQDRSDPVGPVLKKRFCGRHVEGTSKQEALPAVAVLVSEHGELLLLLDALGERLDRESLAELHESVQQRLALLVVSEPGDERSVDLQCVDGELLQLGEE